MSMDLYHTLQRGWRLLPEGPRAHIGSLSGAKRALRWLTGHYAPHDELYDAAYFEWIERHAVRSAPAIARSIIEDFSPAYVADVGCGTGALLEQLRTANTAALGLEYSEAALEHCRRRGLTVHRFNLEEPVPPEMMPAIDVAVSLEVAEHLPSKLAEPFVDVLCRASRAVVFTAATPGQGGRDHVNEQPHDYWIAKFGRRGFRLDAPRVAQWRRQWEGRNVSWFYCKNLMIFLEPGFDPRDPRN